MDLRVLGGSPREIGKAAISWGKVEKTKPILKGANKRNYLTQKGLREIMWFWISKKQTQFKANII